MHITVIDGLYQRYQNIVGEIDEKADRLQKWQSQRLHEIAKEAEAVLSGCRRKSDRRN